MPSSLNWLLALRTWVLGTWMFLWTASGLVGLFITEHGTRLIDGPGRWVAVAALTGTSVFTLGISMSERLREMVVEPSKRELYEARPLVFIGLLTGSLAFQFAFASTPGS